MRSIIYIAITFVILGFTLSIINSLTTTIIKDVKVEDTIQQQLIKGSGGNMRTEIRYIVVTNKGTFICKSNFLQGKFNNSDLFYHLKKDSTYSLFKVSGLGKGFLFDYQNIIEVK